MRFLYFLISFLLLSISMYAQTAGISGSILRVDNTPMPDVTVTALDENGTVVQSTLSQQDGSYQFAGLPAPAAYTIHPHYEGNVLEDVSTLDIVLGARHILGVQSLSSPYEIIAGDVNLSQTFTTFDLIQMRKVILNIESAFLAGSWRFVDASFQFPEPDNPLNVLETAAVAVQLDTDVTALDFIGIKMGNLQQD
jgi:hypothetical protein